MADPITAPLSDVDRALVGWCYKLTLTPQEMTEADLEPLRAQGLSDRAIHDAAQVVALFAYFNRLADGLGVRLGDDDTGR